MPVWFCQNLLDHQGVDVDHTHLEQVHGKHSYLLLFPVVGNNLAAATVENQLSSPAMWRVVNRAVEVCASRGLIPEETKPHDLRHTFAHRYLQQHPGDLVGLARLLGHASLDTTKIYTQPTTGELAERVEQLPLNAYG